MNNDGLLPCPFCQSTRVVLVDTGEVKTSYVACLGCCMVFSEPQAYSVEDIVKSFNTRPFTRESSNMQF